MIDGIIKADGTSRLMRATLPATYDEFKAQAAAGTLPLDVLFNAEGWNQLPTFLNKSNLLKDATATLFGMGTGATPNDVLSWLGEYNLHWWRTRNNASRYVEHLETLGTLNVMEVPNYSHAGYDIYYYDNLTFDASGNFVLSGEHTVVVSYDTYTAAEVLRGKYFYPTRNGTSLRDYLYYMPTTAGITRLIESPWYYVRSEAHVVSKRYVDGATAWTCVRDSNRNAYPDSGIVENVEYQYLGIPFENAVTAPKIATGSYTGTGKSYNVDYYNSLSFDFAPKLVIVTTDSGMNGYAFVFGTSRTLGLGGYYSQQCLVTWEGNKLTWYNTSSNADNQLNASGQVYKYFAIG